MIKGIEMLQYLNVFGIAVNMYKFFFYLGLATVPVFLFALRKRFGYTKAQAAKYSALTLAFGLFAAYLTAVLKRAMLSYAMGSPYMDTENLRNYGIPIFLPILMLIFCLIFRDDFRKVSDYIAPCVYSVMTCVKLGCTFWGCCYSHESDHGIWSEVAGYKTFPVQPLDALTSFIIVLICLYLLRKLHDDHPGYVYPIGGVLFALTKSFWETFRVHDSEFERNYLDTGWTLWQFWLLALFIGCVIWIAIVYNKEKKEEAAKKAAKKNNKKSKNKRKRK